MRIDWKVLDQMLLGELETDDITIKCKEEIERFLQIHDFSVFSEESLKELSGIWKLSIGPAYEEVIGGKAPNIFHVIGLEEEENEW